MKKDVVLTIKGRYRTNGETDTLELQTKGVYAERNGAQYLIYHESDDSGLGGVKTIVKIESNQRVTMKRSGDTETCFVIEKGKRNFGQYALQGGSLLMGISGNDIRNSLTDKGGEVRFRYSIDVNTAVTCVNDVSIAVCDTAAENASAAIQ